MSPRFVLGRENVPCVPEVVNRSLKADCTDFTSILGLQCSIFIKLGLLDAKCVQHKLYMAGNCIITYASSLYHICKEKQVNLSYSACHEKR